jgi:hypothetical protein
MGEKWLHRNSIHERVSNAQLPQRGGEEMIVYDVKSCDYCQSSIATGQRWVREKIYDPRSDGQNSAYRHFHAEPFGGQERSCWQKQQMEREIARVAVTTTNWAAA